MPLPPTTPTLRPSHHRNISNLYAAYFTKNTAYLVLEFMGGGELFQRIVSWGPYGEETARDRIFEVADALHFLHECVQ